jgi:hypothetical protein
MESTADFDALGFAFAVSCDDAALGTYLDEIFAGLAAPAAADHRYVLRQVGASPRGGSCELTLDDQVLFATEVPEELITRLVQDVNRRAVEGWASLVMHAGGVECEGRGLVFPAAMEAGKTTLVAGLVRAGFGYLTDEAVAVDETTLCIRPYPKPLSIERESWFLFPELEPSADLPNDAYKNEQWQVPPSAIRPDAVGEPCPIDVVVFPRYRAGAETTLEPLRRAEALIELAENTFAFDTNARQRLDALAEVVRPAECLRLQMGSLGEAVELVSQLVGISAGEGTPR